MFRVKKKGERVIVIGEIKRKLRGKDHSQTLSIPCKKMYSINFSYVHNMIYIYIDNVNLYFT